MVKYDRWIIDNPIGRKKNLGIIIIKKSFNNWWLEVY